MKFLKYSSLILGLLIVTTVNASSVFSSSNPEVIAGFIQSHHLITYLSLFFCIGVLLAFTPCVLPMVPILSGIIVGQESLSTKRAFRLSLAYVLGMAITYAFAGMLAAYLGSTIQTLMQKPSVLITFSLIFVMMALSMFGLFELKLPASWNSRFSLNKNKGSLLSVFSMGVLSTLVVSPCVTAPLIGVLSYIGQTGQVSLGGIILFVMALGMGLPLLLVGAGYGKVLPKTGPWMLKVKQFFGILMLAIALWMLSRVLPASLISVAWPILLITSLVFFLLQSLKLNVSSLKLTLVSLSIAAASIVITKTFMSPVITQVPPSMQAPFEHINTVKQIDARLAQAKKQHKPVFIEFFASWCSDCQAMDTKVFNQTEIIQAMANSVNIKVDVSESTPEVQAIKKAFPIYGTPTLLFFDSNGQSLKSMNAVGFIDKSKTLNLLKQLSKT
jgi:thiol:disulfide interchange protein DsbD